MNRFNKAKRLTNSKDFNEVFNAPQQQRSCDCYFTVLGHFYCNEEKPQKLRLGLVVAKKRVKLAVRRNRIKRIIRETFRLLDDSNLTKSCDLVVIARDKADLAENQELFSSLNNHFKKFIEKSRDC